MRDGKPESVDAYIEAVADPGRAMLIELRETIRSAAPDATETISYGIPTFRLNGNLVHFAAAKKHIGFYPAPSAILEFAVELASFKTSKGAVQFPLNKPLPVELIARIVAFRAAEQTGSASASGA